MRVFTTFLLTPCFPVQNLGRNIAFRAWSQLKAHEPFLTRDDLTSHIMVRTGLAIARAGCFHFMIYYPNIPG